MIHSSVRSAPLLTTEIEISPEEPYHEAVIPAKNLIVIMN